MGVTHYVWDELSDNVLMETDETGAVTAQYTQEPKPFGPVISQDHGGTKSFYHFDGQGSARQLTDSNEAVTDEATYSAFGTEVARSGLTENPWGYKGALGYYANPGGELYVRARHLGTATGRWMSPDPLPRQAVSEYAYADNRPINMSDPAGMTPCDQVTPIQFYPPPWQEVWKDPLTKPIQGTGKYKICNPKDVIIVKLHFHMLEGGSRRTGAFLQDANMVFAQCCIMFQHTRSFSWSKAKTVTAIGTDMCVKVPYGIYNWFTHELTSPYLFGTSGLLNLTPHPERAFAVSVFLAKCIDPNAYGATPQRDVGLFHPIILSELAVPRTFSHEMGHQLLRYGTHNVPADNLMHPTVSATGSLITEEQCDTMRLIASTLLAGKNFAA